MNKSVRLLAPTKSDRFCVFCRRSRKSVFLLKPFDACKHSFYSSVETTYPIFGVTMQRTFLPVEKIRNNIIKWNHLRKFFDGQWIHQLNINGFDRSKIVRSMSLNNSNSTFPPFYIFTHFLFAEVVVNFFNTVEKDKKGL